MGSWDGGDNVPTIDLPRWNLRAAYWLGGGDMGEDQTGSGVAKYIFTDQVRFYETTDSQPTRLERVPPLAFSEVMRDVDLFVGVCSIGNDPNWVPAGDPMTQYWQDYAFGELSISAESRREVLAILLPRLKIANRATLTPRYLIVKGSLRTYKIHLGSANILMEPNDQYLCIVADRDQTIAEARREMFLPFEGDQMLSIILSKAFLLAEDAKVTAPTITRQIRGS